MPRLFVHAKLDFGVIIKLTIYSLIVGFILYMLRLSPGDIYRWIGDVVASAWNWLSGTGLEYILLGATIVVPLYLFSRLRAGWKNKSKS